MQDNKLLQVPHLTTASLGPLEKIEKHLLDSQVEIESWFRQQWRNTPPTFYSSVDLRNSGFKVAPVDTNLFPAGFNNLNDDFLPLCIQAAQATIENLYPGCQSILIIPENHTQNLFYFESLANLYTILTMAGFAVRIGSLREDISEPVKLTLPSSREIIIEPLIRKSNRIGMKDFNPCGILMNNDLSTGIPPILENLEQPTFPPLNLGWASRLKSMHFEHYANVTQEFAQLLNMDPWVISPLFRSCGNVNFMKREGEECLVKHTTELLADIQKKYDEYGVTHKPYVVIKADSGSYGMGVLPVFSPEELINLNRKKRKDMSITKGSRAIRQVLIQEGVYTFETWNDAVAEPVVYMIGQYVIGGFYRIHVKRGISDNLNAPGMHFAPLAFAEACNKPENTQSVDNCANRFYSYGVIARLALVAAAREQADGSR